MQLITYRGTEAICQKNKKKIHFFKYLLLCKQANIFQLSVLLFSFGQNFTSLHSKVEYFTFYSTTPHTEKTFLIIKKKKKNFTRPSSRQIQ